MSAVTLRFPGHRLATFTTSFGARSVSEYRLIGTEGTLQLQPAYTYAGAITMTLETGDGTERETFDRRDQFAAEIDRFSRCIEGDLDPEAGGHAGLADVRIVEAAYRSARERRPVELGDSPRQKRPDGVQTLRRTHVEQSPREVNASSPRR